jgi:hypothetical protein
MSKPEDGSFLVPAHISDYIAKTINRDLMWFGTRPTPKPLTRRQRLRTWWWSWRETIGYAIAGFDPRGGDDR